jgi:DNA-binding IclR family transcriptional regulator
VLERANALLSAFSPRHRTLSLSGIVMRTGLPKSTAHRTAQQMIKLGWLNYREGQYSLGNRMFEFAGLSPVRTELREAALPFLEDLYEATHATVHLGVMDGLEILYIDKISGHHRVTDLSRVGGRMPLHCTSLGKSIMAFSSRDVLRNVVSHGLPRYTGATITSPTMLERELVTIAARQVAFDRQESSIDIICAGAPVFGPDGQVVAALSVTSPVGRARLDQIAPHVAAAARGVTRALAANSAGARRALLEKLNFSHAGTASTAVRVLRSRRNRMKPGFHLALIR